MATNFTTGDFLTNAGGGVFEEVLRRRKMREAYAQQNQLMAQQQAGMAERTDMQQQGMMDRVNTQQTGAMDRTEFIQGQMNDRAGNKPVKWVPTNQKEAQDMIEFNAKMKQKYHTGSSSSSGGGKGGKQTDPMVARNRRTTSINNIVRSFQNQRYNESPAAELMGAKSGAYPLPQYGNAPLPASEDRNVAIVATDFGIDDLQTASDVVLDAHQIEQEMKVDFNKASRIAYVRKAAEELGQAYSVDPGADSISVEELKNLASMEGRTISVNSTDGMTSVADLAALIVRGGWTLAEIQELLDEYFGNNEDMGDGDVNATQ